MYIQLVHLNFIKISLSRVYTHRLRFFLFIKKCIKVLEFCLVTFMFKNKKKVKKNILLYIKLKIIKHMNSA